MKTEDNLRLEHQLCVALYNATRAVTAIYRPRLRELGLTYSQYTVMLVLWEHEQTTLRDLGHLLHLDSGTLSPMLKRLEQNGLIRRRRGLDDERVLEVHLTDAGRELRAAASAAQRSVEAATGLSAEEFKSLRRQLNDLADRTRAAATA